MRSGQRSLRQTRYSLVVGKLGGRRHYPRPPVREALCSISFEPVQWTLASPGELFGVLKGDYPSAPEERLEPNFTVSEDAVSVQQSVRRYLYQDAEGHLLFASSDQLSVNQVVTDANYEGWEALQSRFLQGVDAFSSVFSPVEVHHVSVRYINIITIPQDEFDISTYFRIPLPDIQESTGLRDFLVRTESDLERLETRLRLTFASVPPLPQSPTGTTIALDLEVHRFLRDSPSTYDLSPITTELHELENGQFEALITDKTRELFS